MKQLLVFAVFALFILDPSGHLAGQLPMDDPTSVEYHPFVRYDLNVISEPTGGSPMTWFYERLDTLMMRGTGKVNIVHIGGSHIQTDLYSHQVRAKLQNMQPGLNGGRGLVFPVSVAGSNNPRNFSASASGHWQACRNTQRNATCNYGLTGMMIATADTLATLTITNRDTSTPHNTTIIRIHSFDPALNYSINLLTDDPWLVNCVESFNPGITEIRLNNPVETFTLEFSKAAGTPGFIELYGVELTNEDPGIVYHSFGVNGASIPSFLRTNLLTEQLAMIQPDLVILSLGTNDAFSKSFDAAFYQNNYIQLIDRIRSVAPNTSIIITVPNDVYLNKKRVNHNTTQQEEVIFKLADSHHCAVWNFFGVMGGLNSVPAWYSNGMMQKDRVHFTPKGYHLKGDLLFSALIKAYGNHLESLSSEQNNSQ